MKADGTSCRDGTYCHADSPLGNQHSDDDVRLVLASSRQAHMLAIQFAIARGFPVDELNHGEEAFANVTRQMRTICQAVGTDAPMVLGVIE